MDNFEIMAFRCIVRELKSMTVALALTKRHITAKEAIELGRLEEEFQIERWGLVEGGHDLDRVNCSVNVHSASFFLWLLKERSA